MLKIKNYTAKNAHATHKHSCLIHSWNLVAVVITILIAAVPIDFYERLLEDIML